MAIGGQRPAGKRTGIPRPSVSCQRESWGLTVATLALVSAVAVGVPSLPQPLLEAMSTDYEVSLSTVGMVATCAQFGAALGILFLVPLADVVRPRLHLAVQLSVCAVALILAGFVPALPLLSMAFALAAICSVAAQVILPIALREAPEVHRARSAAVLGGSLLFGVFGGRLLAGLLTAQFGWRTAVVTYGCMLIVAAACAWVALRRVKRPNVRVGYHRLLASIPRIAFRDSTVALSAISHGLTFAAFSAVWAVIASHLMSLDEPWSPTQAGLVNLIGVGAGFIALSAGFLVARLGPVGAVRLSLPIVIVSALAMAFFSSGVLLVLAALLLLSAANQTGHVANQTHALSHHGESAGRANTVYMFTTMLGGALGVAAATALYPTGGMVGTALFCAGCASGGLLAALLRDRRRRPSVHVENPPPVRDCPHDVVEQATR